MGRERTSGPVSDNFTGRSRSNSNSKREPFRCQRNTSRPRGVAVIDINIDDRIAVTPEDTSNDDGFDRPGPPRAGCARIFFCPNEGYLDALEDYLEFGESGVPEDVEPRGARASWRASGDSDNCPYDLRDLASWIRRHDSNEGSIHTETGSGTDDEGDTEVGEQEIEESGYTPRLLAEAEALFTFTELCFTTRSKKIEDAYGTLVQHKIYLFDSDDDDTLTIVWRCCDSKYSQSSNKLQMDFIDQLLKGEEYFKLDPGIMSSRDNFLASFLLLLLALDINLFEGAVHHELDPKLVADLAKPTDTVSTNYFEAMTGRIYSFNRIKAMVEKAEDIKETWAYLCQSLGLNNKQPRRGSFELQIQLETLRCASLVKHTKRLDARHQDLFTLNTTVSQSRQSFSVTILTVLAAMFLPLSLASAILSMQYRFHELGPILYDFFGVAWLFCTFAIICFVLFRYGNRLLDRFWRLKHLEKRDYNSFRRAIRGVTYSYVLGWTLVLVSFLLGMFLNKETVDWRAYPILAVGMVIFITSPFVVPFFDLVITIFVLFGACLSMRKVFHKDKATKELRTRIGRNKGTNKRSGAELV